MFLGCIIPNLVSNTETINQQNDLGSNPASVIYHCATLCKLFLSQGLRFFAFVRKGVDPDDSRAGVNLKGTRCLWDSQKPCSWYGFFPVFPTFILQEVFIRNSMQHNPLDNRCGASTPSNLLLESSYRPQWHTHPQMALTAEMRTDGGCVS